MRIFIVIILVLVPALLTRDHPARPSPRVRIADATLANEAETLAIAQTNRIPDSWKEVKKALHLAGQSGPNVRKAFGDPPSTRVAPGRIHGIQWSYPVDKGSLEFVIQDSRHVPVGHATKRVLLVRARSETKLRAGTISRYLFGDEPVYTLGYRLRYASEDAPIDLILLGKTAAGMYIAITITSATPAVHVVTKFDEESSLNKSRLEPVKNWRWQSATIIEIAVIKASPGELKELKEKHVYDLEKGTFWELSNALMPPSPLKVMTAPLR